MSDKEEVHVTEDSEVIRRSSRPRKLSSKGLQFAMETKWKRLSDINKRLESITENIQKLMNAKSPVHLVRREYSLWLNKYDEFLNANDDYSLQLSETGRARYTKEFFDVKNISLRKFKQTVERWFSDAASNDNASQWSAHTTSLKSLRSHRSSSSISSQRASIASAKLKEEQRRAELNARSQMLKEKQRLAKAKLDIEHLTEELDLRTELAVSNAKGRVLDQFEHFDDVYSVHNSVETNDNMLRDHIHGCKPNVNRSTLCNSIVDHTDNVVNVNEPRLDVNDRNVIFCEAPAFHREPDYLSDQVLDLLAGTKQEELDTLVDGVDPVSTATNVRCVYSENVGSGLIHDKTGNHIPIDSVENGLEHVVHTQNVGNSLNHFNTDNHIQMAFDRYSTNYGLIDSHVKSIDPDTDIKDNPKDNVNVRDASGTTSIIDNKHHVARSTPPDQYELNPAQNVVMSMVKQLKKPTSELKKFDGKPIEYARFMRHFKTTISVLCDSDDERMSYLEQCTTGEANRIVQGFSYLDATIGYNAAIKEFNERYGSNDVVANAFINKALNWPQVKGDNPKSLDDFGIFLVECENAIKSLEAVRILEYPNNLQQLVKKLPFYIQEKWRTIVQNTKTKGSLIKFCQLVELVKGEAKKANDPMYGKAALSNNSHGHPKKSKGTYATNMVNQQTVEETTVPLKNGSTVNLCPFCKKANHRLDKCDKFRDLQFKEKIDFLKTKGRCFSCMEEGHRKRFCKKRTQCDVCKGNHPTILHIYRNNSQSGNEDTEVKGVNASAIANSSYQDNERECLMAIVPVRIRRTSCSKDIITYAFLDPGSSVSFCTEKIMRQLGCEGHRLRITLDTMGVPHTMNTYSVNNLEICDLDGNHAIVLPKVYTKKKMPVSKYHIPTQNDIDHWEHLRGVHLPSVEADIGLLIGNNIPDAYTPISIKTGPRNSPYASKTMIGWIVWNVIRNHLSNAAITVNRADILAIESMDSLNQLNKMVQQSIRLDFPERSADERKENSIEDKRFIAEVESSIKFTGDCYQISLPFKRDTIFPNNQEQAKQRLESLRKKLVRQPQFCSDYTEFMNNIISKGYSEIVPEEDIQRQDGKVWYIPHHGVYHPNKPNKIRVVFDCSAKSHGISLNEALLSGPDLTNNLVGVLLRFRQEPIALMADIESMFYQVKVPADERDMLRFLWWPDGNLEKEPAVYRMTVHLFGAISSPSCVNTALHHTAIDNKHLFDSAVTDTIMRNFYVDDCLKSVHNEESAVSLARDLRSLCLMGGFRLTKWISNSRLVLDSIPPEERAKDIKELDLDYDTLPMERALGVWWSIESDSLGFRIRLRPQPATRRGILSTISSVYDPLGLAAPFILPAKILLQELCRSGIGWDEEISGKNLQTWQKWLQELPELEKLSIRRCYVPVEFKDIQDCQIHNFSDASEVGYGMVSYLRIVDSLGKISCILLMSKSRVAPIKKITVPRLELASATIAVRLNKMLVGELEYPVDRVVYWTDSMAVLRYIRNENSRFLTYVANRVAIIRDGSEVNQWYYVESRSNPADDASRGLTLDKVTKVERWIHGPDFLLRPENEWPHQPDDLVILDDDKEVKKIVNLAVENKETNPTDKLISHFSEWTKLKKAVGWILNLKEVLLFLSKRRKELKVKYAETDSQQIIDKEMRQLRFNTDSKLKKGETLTVDMLMSAEMAIVQYAQYKHFANEIQILQGKSDKAPKFLAKCSSIHRLDPILDKGLLRVGGRLNNSAIPYESKHPAILPGIEHSHVSNLILNNIHKLVGHLGRESMLATLRQKYWIVHANAAAKKITSKCIVCRKYQARVGEQKMADLPVDRVTPNEPPFTRVGIDYFGPFDVKRGRSSLKRYGVVFTCFATRAVHLEVAHSLDTDSCIGAIRRFIARRGNVKIMRSDNGTNLVGADRLMKEEIAKWNESKLKNQLSLKGIDWKFNPPSGSHFGGVWERMIRTVRKILYSLLQEQPVRLDDESLPTLFCEVEMIINNRPITTISDDVMDLEPLTPNHLLLHRPLCDLPTGIFDKTDNYARCRWRQIQYLADIYWKRWVKEYLPLLQERKKWCRPKRNVAVNDVVMIVDSGLRGSYTLGRVESVVEDKKGLVRIVNVKTKTTTLQRPIDKLVVLLEAD